MTAYFPYKVSVACDSIGPRGNAESILAKTIAVVNHVALPSELKYAGIANHFAGLTVLAVRAWICSLRQRAMMFQKSDLTSSDGMPNSRA